LIDVINMSFSIRCR